MSTTEQNKVDWNKHIDLLADLQHNIDFNKVTILTGGNGKGKSVVRKLLSGRAHREGIKVWSCSMDKRAGVDASMGGMMVFGRDCEWLPTSINTYNGIDGFVKAEDSYGILDEIEIGMSEESQAGVANYINSHLDEYLKKNKGLLVITHSRLLAKMLKADEFINLEGMTKEEWINRDIIPTDFEVLAKDSNDLYNALEKRLKSA